MALFTSGPDDPRHRVTETAFRVNPDLLGRPLARPLRRLAAVLADLSLAGLLVLFREVGTPLFAVALGWVLWRVADPDADVRLPRRWLRGGLRAAAVLAVVVGVASVVATWAGDGPPDHGSPTPRAGAETAYRDESEVTERVREGSAAPADTPRRQRRPAADSLLDALVSAAAAGDTARVRELRPRVRRSLASAGGRRLRQRLEELDRRLDRASGRPGLTDVLTAMLDDLGLGFGSLGIYFTAFLVFWRGRTPGKRLFGLRVVKVRGGELTTWDAFSRVGGYVACLVTGLLGFAQILWDPNRQGLHDRIAGTVVIRE